MAKGGVRPGSGRPKGKLSPENAAALHAKRLFIRRVAKNANKLFNAQLTKAIGETYLMVRVKERNAEGKVIHTYHEIVTDPQTIINYLDGEEMGGTPIHDDEHYYYMTTKPADNAAISSMLDRGLGKPTEHLEADITSDGERINSVSESQLAQLLRARSGRSDI